MNPLRFLIGALAIVFITSCATPTATPTTIPTIAATATAKPLPSATITEPPPTATPIPSLVPSATPGFSVQRDVTYCTVDGVALKLDMYFPSRPIASSVPVVLNIHGGSWRGGDKSYNENQPEIEELARRGFLVVTVNYRFAPTYKFPAQIEDVKCAVRFLRANATKYQLNPDHIGAMGCSAGGHLAALLGVTKPQDGFEGKGGFAQEPSRVQAVATFSAQLDLTTVDLKKPERADTMLAVFGATSANIQALVHASPITYVAKNDPPFLIFQADNDPFIAFTQVTRFYEKLQSASVPATVIVARNSTHCLTPNAQMFPSREQITKLTADFFERTLR